MGDRACVNIKSAAWVEDTYLYTHWRGSQLPEILKAAMKRGILRWRDPVYLARIIFCEMVKGQEMEITGFGISTRPYDGVEFVVDTDEQTISYDEKVIPFADFVKD